MIFRILKDALKKIADIFDHKLIIEDNEEGRDFSIKN